MGAPAEARPEPLNVGIHYGIHPDRYHEDPCIVPSLSSSLAQVLVEESPAHAWLQHPRLGKPADPEAYRKNMSRGTVMHALMLGVSRRVVLVKHKDFKTNDAKTQRDHALANGAIPVLADDLLEWDAACDPLREEMRNRWGIELDGRSEVVVVWREILDDGTEVLCRCQMDHLLVDDWERPRSATIVDLKFTDRAAPDFIERQWLAMGYDIQREAYTRAIEAALPSLMGRVEFKLAFCEPERPHAVTVSEAGGLMRDVGAIRWRLAVKRWAAARTANAWPPVYTRSVVRAEPKSWEYERWLYSK